MFKYNRSENRLDRLKKRRFGDLNLQERPHLQEWLAQMPEALEIEARQSVPTWVAPLLSHCPTVDIACS